MWKQARDGLSHQEQLRLILEQKKYIHRLEERIDLRRDGARWPFLVAWYDVKLRKVQSWLRLCDEQFEAIEKYKAENTFKRLLSPIVQRRCARMKSARTIQQAWRAYNSREEESLEEEYVMVGEDE